VSIRHSRPSSLSNDLRWNAIDMSRSPFQSLAGGRGIVRDHELEVIETLLSRSDSSASSQISLSVVDGHPEDDPGALAGTSEEP
jgi:hypothetical protein